MMQFDRAILSSILAAAIMGLTSFPAVYVGLGIALPASQSIHQPSNDLKGDAAHAIVEKSEHRSLSFTESLSLQSNQETSHPAVSYRLTREPSPLLEEFSIGVSIAIALVAGFMWRSRTSSTH